MVDLTHIQQHLIVAMRQNTTVKKLVKYVYILLILSIVQEESSTLWAQQNSLQSAGQESDPPSHESFFLKVANLPKSHEIATDKYGRLSHFFIHSGHLYAFSQSQASLLRIDSDYHIQKIMHFTWGNRGSAQNSIPGSGWLGQIIALEYNPFNREVLALWKAPSIKASQSAKENPPFRARIFSFEKTNVQDIVLQESVYFLPIPNGWMLIPKSKPKNKGASNSDSAAFIKLLLKNPSSGSYAISGQPLAFSGPDQQSLQELHSLQISSWHVNLDYQKILISSLNPPRVLELAFNHNKDSSQTVFSAVKNLDIPYGMRAGFINFPGKLFQSPQGHTWISDNLLQAVQIFKTPQPWSRGGIIQKTPESSFHALVKIGDEHQSKQKMLGLLPETMQVAFYDQKNHHINFYDANDLDSKIKTLPHHRSKMHFLRGKPPGEICQYCHDSESISQGRPTPIGHDDLLSHAGSLPETMRSKVAEDKYCQACHSFHDKESTSQAGLFSGDKLCTTCHEYYDWEGLSHPTSKASSASSLRDESNPEVSCNSCHSLHLGTGSKALVVDAKNINSLCANCHASQLIVNPVMQQTSERGHPTDSQDINCLSCHRVHHDELNDELMRPGKQQAKESASSKKQFKQLNCISCHKESADVMPAHRKKISENISPMGSNATSGSSRVSAMETLDETVKFSWEGTGYENCMQCHVIHTPANTSSPLLRFQNDSSADQAMDPASRLCLNCHYEDFAKPVNNYNDIHPEKLLSNFNIGYSNKQLLQLYAPNGEPVTKKGGGGSLGCLSCHTPHGHAKDGKQKDGLAEAKTILPFCTSCHSSDAMLLYKEFHGSKPKPEDSKP